MAWLAGGAASSQLDRLLHDRGAAFSPGAQEVKALESAGAEPRLVQSLAAKHSANHSGSGAHCPALLVGAAEQVRDRHYAEAEYMLRPLETADPRNPAVHFALGYLRQQQGDWDEALDEYQESEGSEPGFSETHSRLAYVFYRSDDPDDAIAEARTALSLDPQNAEAYRYLGLGLYSRGEYPAAMHAFDESLARNSRDAYVLNDLGIALHDLGSREAAATAYRKAIQLDSGLWEAHSNLGIVLHEMKNFDQAIAQFQAAKRLAPNEPAVRNNLANTYSDSGDTRLRSSSFASFFARVRTGSAATTVWRKP